MKRRKKSNVVGQTISIVLGGLVGIGLGLWIVKVWL